MTLRNYLYKHLGAKVQNNVLYYIMEHYSISTLHYITLYRIALYCIHYITLCYITLHHIALHYITLYYIAYIMLHYITGCKHSCVKCRHALLIVCIK